MSTKHTHRAYGVPERAYRLKLEDIGVRMPSGKPYLYPVVEYIPMPRDSIATTRAPKDDVESFVVGCWKLHLMGRCHMKMSCSR